MVFTPDDPARVVATTEAVLAMQQALAAHQVVGVHAVLLAHHVAGQPALLAIAGEAAEAWVVDLRVPEVAAMMAAALGPVPLVVAHDLRSVPFELVDARFSAARSAWCTETAERALHLGLVRRSAGGAGLGVELGDLRERYQVGVGLGASVPSALAAIRSSLADGLIGERIARRCAELARLVLEVRAAQVQECQQRQLLSHLLAIEMPAAVAHAEATATGVRLDRPRLDRLQAEWPSIRDYYCQHLAAAGLADPEDRLVVERWVSARGHHDLFLDRGVLRVDEGRLKDAQSISSDYRTLRRYLRVRDLCRGVLGLALSSDGRVHPQHIPLYANTGRSACRYPEIAGLMREMRPLVIAAPGYGLVELDFASMDLCCAAGLYGDARLVEDCQTGDAVSVLTKVIFADHIDTGVALAEVKQRFSHLREISKRVIYGNMLYGATVGTLAPKLGANRCHADRLVKLLLDHCPQVRVGQQRSIRHAAIHGEVPILGGLTRRLTVEDRQDSARRDRLAKNTPIQGAAGVVFRRALVLTSQALRPLGGRVVLQNHDALLIEAPLERLPAATQAASVAMVSAFVEFFPAPTPRVEVESRDPTCWNKGGRSDSFDRFLADPDYRV